VIRVLLVDDQALVRAGFRAILELEDDLAVVGEAADGHTRRWSWRGRCSPRSW
jgi:DNA-binding NarL/FixJ family response regulator